MDREAAAALVSASEDIDRSGKRAVLWPTRKKQNKKKGSVVAISMMM